MLKLIGPVLKLFDWIDNIAATIFKSDFKDFDLFNNITLMNCYVHSTAMITPINPNVNAKVDVGESIQIGTWSLVQRGAWNLIEQRITIVLRQG